MSFFFPLVSGGVITHRLSVINNSEYIRQRQQQQQVNLNTASSTDSDTTLTDQSGYACDSISTVSVRASDRYPSVRGTGFVGPPASSANRRRSLQPVSDVAVSQPEIACHSGYYILSLAIVMVGPMQ